jgi:hypothetical protein
MKKLFSILLSFSFGGLGAQITIDNSIKAKDNDTLHILNLGTPVDSTNLISVNDIRENVPLFFTGSLVNDTFMLQLDSSLIELKKGLPVYISSSNENVSSLFIKVNGTTYNVKKNNGYPISGSEVVAQKVCIFIFDGTAFIFLNSELPKCPSTFAQPNTSYCIEKGERPGNFWTAVTTCNSLGYRLCSWSEWYYACQKAGTGMTQITNNWEWINNGQNEPTDGKTVGYGKCYRTTHQALSTNYFFRCCLSY